jgi:hypothetical protein
MPPFNSQDVRVLVQEDEGNASVRGERAEFQRVTARPHTRRRMAGEGRGPVHKLLSARSQAHLSTLILAFAHTHGIVIEQASIKAIRPRILQLKLNRII